jgi:hypothetical protein
VTTSASSATGPSLTSATPGYATGVAPVAAPCPRHQN